MTAYLLREDLIQRWKSILLEGSRRWQKPSRNIKLSYVNGGSPPKPHVSSKLAMFFAGLSFLSYHSSFLCKNSSSARKHKNCCKLARKHFSQTQSLPFLSTCLEQRHDVNFVNFSIDCILSGAEVPVTLSLELIKWKGATSHRVVQSSQSSC